MLGHWGDGGVKLLKSLRSAMQDDHLENLHMTSPEPLNRFTIVETWAMATILKLFLQRHMEYKSDRAEI